MKRSVLAGIAVVVGVAAVALWLVVRAEEAPPFTLGGSGIIEATQVPVSPAISGSLVAVPALEGQSVHSGQPLARLDQTVLKRQLDSAQAQVAAAKDGVAAARDQVDSAQAAVRKARDTGTDADIDAAKAQVRVAQAQVGQAQAALKQSSAQLGIAKNQIAQATIVSPLDGVVMDVPADVGEVVSPGQTLAVVGDLAHIRLVIYVPEPSVGQVRLGQKASVTADGVPGRTFRGTVGKIAQQAEFTPTSVQTKEQRTKLVFAVTIDLPNPGGALKPGMPADATLE